MPNHPDALSLARAYHQAWSSEHFEEASSYLADQLEIEVPINAYPTKLSFVEAVRRTRGLMTSVEMLAELGNESEAVLIYDLCLAFGRLRVAEHFTAESGAIRKIRQIHDTAAVRAALGGT